MIFYCQFFSRVNKTGSSIREEIPKHYSHQTVIYLLKYDYDFFKASKVLLFLLIFLNLWICNHINKVFTFCSATYISNCTFFPIPYIRVFPDFSDRYISTCFMYLLSWNASLAAIAIIISWIKILPIVLPFEILSYIPNKHTHRLSHYDIHLISNSTKSLWLQWHFIYWLILA